MRTLLRRPADKHQSRILQLVVSLSLVRIASITVHQNSIQQGIPVDPLYIEDTDDWLGNPTPLEPYRHQLRMYENEFEALTLKEERALENIQGLVRGNDALTEERNSLRTKLQYAEGYLLSERRRSANVEHNRSHLFNENQRLLREARDREEMAGHCECCAEKGL
ncbi:MULTISPECIES: hypothetical protein [unclassified Pseudomonas]|uniref:hypothetical protein n=1 Tax=unclassified Pseudomonas TaxID=196821 RepID=UPI00215C2E7A|nr:MULTISPECIES: hypothetical protein [unclassified Pseudomonas]MCR8931883.1 hypothetical protein [Pseudomonas sp. S11A4]MCR8975492.1 hypothetical protein [Pseudomonas sp. S11P7]